MAMSGIALQIFSPSYRFVLKDYFVAPIKTAAYYTHRILETMGCPKSILESMPGVSRAASWTSPPALPSVNPKLRPFLQSPVFGLRMFQTLSDSKVALNVHADSSPTHASNMKLFETTGVGTCLVTDWKNNLPQLFETDREIVTYRSAPECTEKIRWLIEHPEEREKIATAGRARTLRDHTFQARAIQLDSYIRQALHGAPELQRQRHLV